MLKICRFCLCHGEASLIYLTELIDSEHTIEDVMVYTGIQIDANQLDAYVVCLKCTTTLNTFATFRKTCITNDSVFHELWQAASVQETQVENVESIDLSNSAEGAMDVVHLEYHTVEEEENCNPVDIVANNVCQESYVVGEYFQDSVQNIHPDANFSTQTEEARKNDDDDDDDDFYSANYIKPSVKLFTDNVYFGDNTSNWSCYYWPPKRPKVPWQSEPGKRKHHLCDACGIMVGHMPTHALVHKPQPSYACPHCSVKMNQKCGIVQHIKTVHLKVVSKTCHLCGKNFVHRKTYVYHMRTHKDAEESFECKVCSKTFFRSIGLEAHVRKVHSIAK